MGKYARQFSEHFGAEKTEILNIDFLKGSSEKPGQYIGVPHIEGIVVIGIWGILDPLGLTAS